MNRLKKYCGIICSIGLILSGCSSPGDMQTESESTEENSAAVSLSKSQEDSSAAATKLLEAGTGMAALKKEEMVYASADAEGNVYKTTVETTLISDGDEPVLDSSRLSDIKNTQGGEEFVTLEDGTMLWENLGEDIVYEGTGEEELPVQVHVIPSFDILNKRFLDCIVQPIRKKNEFLAMRQLIDSQKQKSESVPLFIADRGFHSLNVFAHAIENNYLFMIRATDVKRKRARKSMDPNRP